MFLVHRTHHCVPHQSSPSRIVRSSESWHEKKVHHVGRRPKQESIKKRLHRCIALLFKHGLRCDEAMRLRVLHKSEVRVQQGDESGKDGHLRSHGPEYGSAQAPLERRGHLELVYAAKAKQKKRSMHESTSHGELDNRLDVERFIWVLHALPNKIAASHHNA